MLPEFRIVRPDSAVEACQLLADHDGEAAAYAGGTELLLAMKLGFADYPLLLDLKQLPELAGLLITGDTVRIGATVTHRYLERAPALATVLPSLPAMAARIANPRVRAVGTIGGNLAFGEPHSDPATYLLALDATLECQDASGQRRRLPAEGFLTGPFQTGLGPDELLAAVSIPRPAAGTRIDHQRLVLTERPAAIATAALRIRDGIITRARLAIGAVTPVPTRVSVAEELLTGVAVAELADLLPRLVTVTAQAAPVEAGPGDAYRRQLIGTLVGRTARTAAGLTAG